MVASSFVKRYGNPPLIDKMTLIASLLSWIPMIVVWTLLTSPFHPHNRHKSWKRVAGDTTFHLLTKNLNVKQLQWLLGTTQKVYVDWAQRNGHPVVIDDLGEDSRLLWIGQRRTDRVILYFHGGGYLFPMFFFANTFWKRTLTELESRDIKTGFATLNYSLVPTASFPTQLRQAVLALEHLISKGVEPQNIQITGDSAGGNLALALVSHMLHPLDSIPRVKLTAPIGGLYLMSPWVSLSAQTGSMITNDSSDVVGIKCLMSFGAQVLASVASPHRPYIEAVHAPSGWFKAMDTIVERVLITAGDAECLRDVISGFAEQICQNHSGVTYICQERGVHDDPLFDCLFVDICVSQLTSDIWDWLATGFVKS